MHYKALIFNDHAAAAAALQASSPRAAKAIGRQVKNFSSTIWEQHREAVVRRGNMLKFTRAITEDGFRMGTSDSAQLPLLDSSLREMLLRTGQAELVEASPFDCIWGIGFAAEYAPRVARENWGMNLLGKALMEVRRELREQG